MHVPSRRHILAAAVAAPIAATLGRLRAAPANGSIRLGGTGVGLGLQRQLGAAFKQRLAETSISVLPSMGSDGGIRAVIAGAMDIAFSGRSLTPDEQKHNLLVTPILRSPVAVITSHPSVTNVTQQELVDIFATRRLSWPDGTPIRIILRPKFEATYIALIHAFPNLGSAIELARGRFELPVATTDQENIALAERLSGSLSVALQIQLLTESAAVRPLALNGVPPTVENMSVGAYPWGCDIFMVTRSDADDRTLDLAKFIVSEQGARVIERFGGLPTHRRR